jgi:TatD DNase family protein
VLTDTHTHLDLQQFAADLPEVIERARVAGVKRMLVPAVSALQWDRLLALAEQYPEIYIALGMHPCFKHQAEDLDRLELLLAQRHPKVVAVGECGLDWTVAGSSRESQLWFLEQQWRLAQVHDLPIILHVRKAHSELMAKLKSDRPTAGAVVHAFSGSFELASDYLKHGCLLGIGGVITYPRAAKTAATVARLPMDALLLETDAPDMPLFGFQGQRNEPAQVRRVAEALAEIKQQTVADIIAQTGSNAERIFGLAGRV